MDRTLVEASKDLGAGRWATFRQITLPITLPGLITGSILVFIPLMGEYVIPAILGYGRVFLVGNQLVLQFLEARNWPEGAARAVVLILIMLITITFYLWFTNRGRQEPRSERHMTAPATPVVRTGEPTTDAGVDVARRPAPRKERFGGLVEVWLRAHTLLIYLFLYLPIVVVVVFSFNATNRRVTDWQGFSIRWYESVLGDTVVPGALLNSFIVGALDRDHRDRLRHDGGARPAAGTRMVPDPVRRR